MTILSCNTLAIPATAITYAAPGPDGPLFRGRLDAFEALANANGLTFNAQHPVQPGVGRSRQTEQFLAHIDSPGWFRTYVDDAGERAALVAGQGDPADIHEGSRTIFMIILPKPRRKTFKPA